jgi:xylan 1,4-beta-xylosidase
MKNFEARVRTAGLVHPKADAVCATRLFLIRKRTKPGKPASRTPMVIALVLAVLAAVPSAPASLLSSNQLVFANVDHAPIGCCSTITYGYKGDICGIGTETGNFPYWQPSGGGGGGVLIGLSGKSGLQITPFVASTSSISTNAHYFSDNSIQRQLTPCTDQFSVAGVGLTFTHYTPVWPMTDLATATLTEKKRFFLPATWMVFTIQNTNSTSEDFYFGLPVAVTGKTFANGAYQGFTLGESAFAVQTGSCEVLSGARLTSTFNGMTKGSAFHLSVPAGQVRTLTVVIAYYRSAVVDSRTGSSYYYTSLYPSIDSVIDAAFAGSSDAQFRCQQLATVMSRAGLNPYRQFMACYTLHTHMADTACLIDPQGRAHWIEIEGVFNYINTFDLTEDHSFYDSYMYPWALRNVLDGYSGALAGNAYTYDSPLYSPNGTQVSTHGFSFDHDMGLWPTSGTGPAYGSVMGDEELQSWILSAGMYWSQSKDDAWLTNNLGQLQTCLTSMLSRDNTNAAARDGVTKNVNTSEITTYDSLDWSLQKPAFSGRLAVRNWACYLALNAMFNQIGDTADAATCDNMASTAAQTIVARWNTYHSSLGYIPALLDGSSMAATLPMVEGLVYPSAMGLTNAIDRVGGPYAAMLQALSNHVMAVLVPGKCLDATTGAGMITSGSSITWQSKVFLSQYAAEAVLGITNSTIDGDLDQANISVQLQGAPFQGFCDAFQGSGPLAGGHHYPRGVTTALWWLNGTNNPTYPKPTMAPAIPTLLSAIAGDQQVLLSWNGVSLATGYNLKRATASGGPYTTVTNGLPGASFTDSGLTDGLTYYYILNATNQVGESLASPELSAIPVPSVPTNLTPSVQASTLTISWPSTYVGWILQTNGISLGNPAQWNDVPPSTTRSQMSFPLAPNSATAEFFRLRHP